MANPYTASPPPAPRPPDTRPLRRRKRVWLGGSGLFLAGLLVATPGNGDEQQPVQTKVKAGPTVTATVTTTPEPGPTVTETVKAKAKPAPTVTVTKTATVAAAGTGTGSGGGGGGGGGGDSTGTCSIVSNSGNCYSAGQFCRNSDHGATTTTASGSRIRCVFSPNAWRWKYA
ncbi:hypothetical protein [Streptomyces sp. KAU_LT]|uniref:hypothetical protein n=1 Tax=Streptomyces sp. KAU_LT TaxID=3046669 RepID=UPI0024B72857|nr:hypothetical protein [Streptomyces sp. KAU_LT]MDI9832466.1 hypothetical protein [Streptomyces sp. KAU_LT]